MFTGRELANYALTVYRNRKHWCYWYGTYGNRCTVSKYERKSNNILLIIQKNANQDT